MPMFLLHQHAMDADRLLEGQPIKIERADMKSLTNEELKEYERLVRKTRTPRSDGL
jgi:hypothetical protein